MRGKLVLVVAALAVTTSAQAAPVRVVFEGTLSHFDAGYEAVMSPTEKVRGEYVIDPTAQQYLAESLIWGPSAAAAYVHSGITLRGESGWAVDEPAGVLTMYAPPRSPGPNAPQRIPDEYDGAIYSVSGGVVYPPTPPRPPENPEDWEFNIQFIDVDGDGTFSDGDVLIAVGADNDDLHIIERPLPVVGQPTIHLQVHGPSEWWNADSNAQAPPPLDEAVSATVTLQLPVSVPYVGYQWPKAVFNVTRLEVVPEPRSSFLAIPALALLAARRRRA